MMPGLGGNARRKDLGFRYEVTGAQSAPYENFTVVCHSEECSDEESAFDLSVLVERIDQKRKQMLHGVYPELCRSVQHDRTANSDRPEEFVFPWRPVDVAQDMLCAFARVTLRFRCGLAALAFVSERGKRFQRFQSFPNLANLSAAAASVSSFLHTANRARCLPRCLSES
jgi:hypothetical protein